MRKYLLPLAFAVSTACAEEPAEPKCIDKIVLDIQIDKVPDDALSSAYHTNSADAKQRLEEYLTKPVKDIYQGHAVPVEVYFEPRDYNEPIDKVMRIPVRYMSVEQLLPDVEAVMAFVAAYADDPTKKKIEALPKSEQVQAYSLVTQFLRDANGATTDRNDIFLFSPNESDYDTRILSLLSLDKYATIVGLNLAHEVGHVLGLKDSMERLLDTGHNDLMYEYSATNAALSEGFRLSETDKATILKQVCKPEGQQYGYHR